VPHNQWPSTPAANVLTPLKSLDTTDPDAILWSALEKMGRDGVNQMPVIDGKEIIGMISREDILHYLSFLESLHAWKSGSGGTQ